MIRVAVIGDIHEQFNACDVAYLNASDYDLILAVGDIVGIFDTRSIPAAHALSRLNKPTLYIPGNHDATTPLQLLAEIKQIGWLAQLASRGQERRHATLCRRLGKALCCGYSGHAFTIRGVAFDIIAARPFSQGGPTLSYMPYLRRAYGVSSLDASVKRLRELVDRSVSNQLIFLAHNGPTGLGSTRDAIWGRDFAAQGGDYGDPDLRAAINYAQACDKRVIAVVAGHMHHALKGGGGQRIWHAVQDGTHYVNAARVPRIFAQGNRRVQHHVRMEVTETEVAIKPMLLPSSNLLT